MYRSLEPAPAGFLPVKLEMPVSVMCNWDWWTECGLRADGGTLGPAPTDGTASRGVFVFSLVESMFRFAGQLLHLSSLHLHLKCVNLSNE